MTGAVEIYFISNQRRQFDSVECTFRVGGKIPELWHPDTGVIEAAPIWSAQDGRTKVRLNFDPAGSVFVIFRHAAAGVDHVIAASGNFSDRTVAAPKLEIQYAVYTANDGAGEMDVTEKISELVRAGPSVSASNDLLGCGPAANHVKELRVDLSARRQAESGDGARKRNAYAARNIHPRPVAAMGSKRRCQFTDRESMVQWPSRITHWPPENFCARTRRTCRHRRKFPADGI